MRMFKDENDKPWVIKIDVAAVKRVRGLLNVDVYKLVSKGMEPLGELLADIVSLVDVIYVLCMEQATADGVTVDPGAGTSAADQIIKS